MYESIINEVLPNALMIGVDYELFWTLNPKTLTPFIKAFSLKQKYDDTRNWELGQYIRMAIVSSMNKEAKYPSRPNHLEVEYQHQIEQQEVIRQRFIERMELLNSRFRKED